MNKNYAQHRQGFTLIEVLIVIGIIAVLVSILALGGKAVMNTVKGDSAKTALTTMANLQAEYESTAGRIDDDTIFGLLNRGVRGDELSSFDLATLERLLKIDEANSNNENVLDFDAIFTQRVLRIMNRNPKVKAAIAKLSNDSIVAVNVIWIPPSNSQIEENTYRTRRLVVNYLPGDVVKWSKANSPSATDDYYVCKVAHTNANPSYIPSNTSIWKRLGPINTQPVFVPRDAWGNPLRYAGTLGLDRLKVDPKNTKLWYGPDIQDPAEQNFADIATPAKPSDPTYHPLWLPLKDGGNNPVHWIKRRLTAPSYTSFWISAGPDGDFETNDDNVYSFVN